MIPNKPNNKVEEIVEEFYQEFGHLAVVKNELSGNQYKNIGDWLRTALTSSYEQGVRDAVGNIGAGLLAQHSPQAVLDAYFDVANKELEKYETDN